jgi:hypothetical protein
VLAEIEKLKDEEKRPALPPSTWKASKSPTPSMIRPMTRPCAIMELQRDRQKVAMERAQTNIDKLDVKAPLAGMVAQENLSRGNSLRHAQEGDQLYRGQPLVSIFDPTEMRSAAISASPISPPSCPAAKPRSTSTPIPTWSCPPTSNSSAPWPPPVSAAPSRPSPRSSASTRPTPPTSRSFGSGPHRAPTSGADALVRARPPGRALAFLVNPSAPQDAIK